MKKLILLLFAFIFLVSVAVASQQTPLAIATAQKNVSAEFTRLDSSLKKAAADLGKAGISGDGARRILATLCGQFSSAVDCCTVDPQGKMVTVEPVAFRRFEGKDISAQDHVKLLLKSHKPVLSAVFRSVEGYEAVDSEYPVFDSKGLYIGSVSLMFKPEIFLADIIKPVVKGVPMDIWAMETGGRILYDADPSQVGLNLFTSPVYKPFDQLLQLGNMIAKKDHGVGVYTFKAYLTNRLSSKKAIWQTVSLYGTDWRLVGIHLEPAVKSARAERPASRSETARMLEELASETAMLTAVATGDNDLMMKQMKHFYEKIPGIYSVQFIDVKGVNRIGYPLENSLLNYDFHSNKAPSDKETLEILAKRKPASMIAPLFEEKAGHFIFRPLLKGEQYLGMLYVIILK